MTLMTTEHLQTFSDALNQRYGNYVLEPMIDESLASGRFKDRSLGTITAGLIDVKSVISRRQKLADHLQDRIFILAPLHGHLVVDQYDRTSRLMPGAALVLDSMAGCTIVVEEQCSALSIELKRSAFDRIGGATRQICARRLEGGHHVGGLLSNVIGTIAANFDGCDPEDGELFAELLVSLVGRIARDGVTNCNAYRVEKMLPEMLAWVRSNVHDPDLTPDRLAQQFGLSRRGIYRHFALIGTTPAKWLWDVRLECAEEKLKTKHASVSEVAFSVGFNDSGHFSRLYKRRFGRPPSMRNKPR